MSARPVGTAPDLLLKAVAESVGELESALEATGRGAALRHSKVHPLHMLDRSLPDQTLDDLLAACEAYATVTGPAALANDDPSLLRVEAFRLLQTLRSLNRVSTHARPSYGPDRTEAAALVATFATVPVRSALAALISILSALAAPAATQGAAQVFTLRLGVRYLVPGSVVALVLALILFLAGGIAFATGALTISPHGVVLTNPLDIPLVTPTSLSGASHQTGAATPTPQSGSNARLGNGSQSNGGTRPTPTAMPSGSNPQPAPTVTPAPSSAPVVSVSPDSILPCPKENFEISFVSGQGTLNWTATSDSTTTKLDTIQTGSFSGSQVSGQLAPLQRIKVYVLPKPGTTGKITVVVSNGVGTFTVNYDSTSCA